MDSETGLEWQPGGSACDPGGGEGKVLEFDSKGTASPPPSAKLVVLSSYQLPLISGLQYPECLVFWEVTLELGVPIDGLIVW